MFTRLYQVQRSTAVPLALASTVAAVRVYHRHKESTRRLFARVQTCFLAQPVQSQQTRASTSLAPTGYAENLMGLSFVSAKADFKAHAVRIRLTFAAAIPVSRVGCKAHLVRSGADMKLQLFP